MYKLKKEEYISKFGESGVREMTLIHSTAACKVNGIIKDNFDWRKVVRSKYGIGVSFSSDADYANCHSNRNNGKFLVLQYSYYSNSGMHKMQTFSS